MKQAVRAPDAVQAKPHGIRAFAKSVISSASEVLHPSKLGLKSDVDFYLDWFKNTAPIDRNTKDEIRGRVGSYLYSWMSYARTRYFRLFVARAFLPMTAFVLIAAFLSYDTPGAAFPLYKTFGSAFHQQDTGVLLYTFGYLLILAVAVYGFDFYPFLGRRKPSQLRKVYIQVPRILLPLLSVFGGLALVPRFLGLRGAGSLQATMLVLLICVMVTATSIYGWCVGLTFLVARTAHRNPSKALDAVVFFLLETMKDLDACSKRPLLEEMSKKFLARDLDLVSDELEEAIFKAFKSNDRSFNQWLKTYASRVAAPIRLRKQNIINAEESTLSDLLEYLAAFFVHFVKGNWSALEQADYSTLPHIPGWKENALKSIRSAAVGLLPILAILLLDSLALIPSQVLGYFYLAGILWALANLLILLDPRILDTIRTAREVTSFFDKR